MYAALGGGGEDVKKEEAQKDEIKLPWKKDKDKVGTLHVYILAKIHKYDPDIMYTILPNKYR